MRRGIQEKVAVCEKTSKAIGSNDVVRTEALKLEVPARAASNVWQAPVIITNAKG